MAEKFDFLKSFNNEIYKNCKTAEFLVNVMENHNSSLNAARTALELLCAEENPDYYQYDSLDEKVRSFISRTSPDDNICNALKAIKINGNEGSHGNGSTRKAKDTIELLEQVLIWYVCGYRGKKYKEADFHPSELKYVYLYCKDLKKAPAKPQKAASDKKVVIEVKNDVVQQDNTPNSVCESSQSVNVSVAEAAPVEVNSPVIDKEEKKRLKLERKAQEEAERKAKRNAERELKKQLQKEQKAKALEEAKRRNEEAVAKENAKLQAQEAKKLAKEKEIEQKRIRAIRQEERRLAEKERLAKIKEQEDAKLMAEVKRYVGLYNYKSIDKQKQELEELYEKVNNPCNSILNVLLDAYIARNSQVLNVYLEYMDKVASEQQLLVIVDCDIIYKVDNLVKSGEYEGIPHDELFKLTKCYSDIVLKLCLDKFLVLEINRHVIPDIPSVELSKTVKTLYSDVDYIKRTLISKHDNLRSCIAEKKYSNANLCYLCRMLKKLKDTCEKDYEEIMKIITKYADVL